MVSKEVSAGWLSKNSLDRHRPVFMLVELQLFVIGCLFWVGSTDGHLSFTSATWGNFAYSAPAEFWAFVTMAFSAITFNGLMKPVRHWMVALGSGLHCLHFLVLSYSAVFTGGEMAIGIYASVLLLPLHMWMLLESLGVNRER